jgi:hypothetical protein
MSDRPFPPDARTAASTAAEAVRALNHLTAPHNGYPGIHGPDDLYATLGELTTLAQRLEQTLAQLSGWAANAACQGHVTVATSGGDSDQTPTTTVAAFEESLDRAIERLRTAANDINVAWSLAGQIVVVGGGPVSPGPPHHHSRQLDLGDLL